MFRLGLPLRLAGTLVGVLVPFVDLRRLGRESLLVKAGRGMVAARCRRSRRRQLRRSGYASASPEPTVAASWARGSQESLSTRAVDWQVEGAQCMQSVSGEGREGREHFIRDGA